MKLLLLAGVVAAAATLSAPIASADPPNCSGDSGYCSPSPGVTYCPDTGGYITPVTGSCPSLWVGPYTPGGLRPNEGLPGLGDGLQR